MEVLTLQRREHCALIRLDTGTHKLLSRDVRAALIQAMHTVESDVTVDSIVVYCQGPSFFTGADLDELRGPRPLPDFRSLFAAIEGCSRPVIAAAHGFALGAGLELMLAAHYRCAVRATILGFPELSLGLIPGAGGTQRLPRLIGLRPALELILSARPLTATTALKFGLLDHVLPPGVPVAEAAFAYRSKLLAAGAQPRRTSEMAVNCDGLTAEWPSAHGGFAETEQCPRRSAISAVSAAVKLPFQAGLDIEARLASHLVELSSRRDG